MSNQSPSPLPPLPLPAGITSSYVSTPSLTYHILEAGFSPSPRKPLLLLLHGFPELAYSWRKTMLPLAAAGYYVVAYDQRGYGRTTGWDARPFPDVALDSFRFTTVVADAVRLVYALGYTEVKCIVGHDFGSLAASLCALIRPDVFKSTVLMSLPFTAFPAMPFDTFRHPPSPAPPKPDIQAALAALDPPRKHYKWYYATPSVSAEMTAPAAGLHAFLRGYFHLKSADWAGNAPAPLAGWSASELAKLPGYYVMPLELSMSETVAADMAHEDAGAVAERASRWLPDAELAVYVQEFGRNTFQGGLNYYRVATDPRYLSDLAVFAGKKIEVPALFVAGREDWGTYQEPGALEGMGEACREFRGARIVEGAGHWVMQEQPEEVVRLILEFLR